MLLYIGRNLLDVCPSYTCYRLKKCVQCNKKVFTKKSQCICNVLKVKDGTEGESEHFKFMTKSYRIGTYAVHETRSNCIFGIHNVHTLKQHIQTIET